MREWIEIIRCWLIAKLGGYSDGSPRGLIKHLAHSYIPDPVWGAAQRAVNKVDIDPSFKGPMGANLGRNIRRDEAAEWTKLYLKDSGYPYRDSDVHLACELLYHLRFR